MKKIILWVIALISLLILTYIAGINLYIQHKFKSDHEYVEKVILQKDSENRGYSDIVKQKIEENFSNESLQKVVQNEARAFRNVVKSKTKTEFINSSKDLTLAQKCSFFIFRKLKIKYPIHIYEEVLSDTSEMTPYYEYLATIRFANTIEELGEYSNETKVWTQEDYIKLCQ